MPPLIAQHLDALRALARQYGLARLDVFGSVGTPAFDPEQSDVDVLVEYPPDYDFGPWLKRHHELRRELSSVLGREVDLLTSRALRDPWFAREATKTRRVVYDASDIAQIA